MDEWRRQFPQNTAATKKTQLLGYFDNLRNFEQPPKKPENVENR